MKNLIKMEEAAIFLSGILVMVMGDFNLSWWAWLLLIFTPDFGMIGYLVNPKIGAITYNFTHHKAIGIACLIIGYFLPSTSAIIAGVIILSHSAFDRVLGFGLKYPDNFKHTSLGNL